MAFLAESSQCLRSHTYAFGVLKLNRHHTYCFQVLAQMAVTGLEWCDFFVWYQHDSHCEVIFFNADIWHAVKNKVDNFFFDNFL